MPATCQDARYIIALCSEDEDGVVTDRVNLAEGASYGVGPGAVYAPPPPQKVARGADSAYRHGSDVVRARYSNSTVEVRELTILGTADVLAERVMRLTTMLEKARLRQERGWGERVYVERDWRYSTYYAWDVDPGPEYFYETVDVLRKEVYRGEFVPPREDVGGILRDGTLAPCRLNLECYPFWQGRMRNIIFEETVENHACVVYPPTETNWLDIDADELPGDAPCLVRLRVENVSNIPAEILGATISRLRIGVKRQDTPQTFEDILQAEDAALGGTSALLSDATFSSCDTTVRVTPATTNMVRRLVWTVSGSALQRGTYKPFVRIRHNPATGETVTAQFRLRVGTARYIYDGPQVLTYGVLDQPAGNVRYVMLDLGIFEIPPMGTEGYDPANYYLEIWTEATNDWGGTTHDIDYMMLLPIEGGLKLTSFVLPSALIWGIPVGYTVEYNGFVEPPLTQTLDLATAVWYSYPDDDLGFLAYLEPGHDHRVFLSADLSTVYVNHRDIKFKVTVDIVPQYLYIR